MIETRGLTKRYGPTVAVDGLSFTTRPGLVTGFLGPNGAGKTTTMRLILGLDYPTAGTVTVNGQPYLQLADHVIVIGRGQLIATFSRTLESHSHPRLGRTLLRAGLSFRSAMRASLMRSGTWFRPRTYCGWGSR